MFYTNSHVIFTEYNKDIFLAIDNGIAVIKRVASNTIILDCNDVYLMAAY